MTDLSNELAYEGLGSAILGDPGVFSGVKGSLFGESGLIDVVGEDLLVLAQGYCVYLGVWVYLDSHGLCPILHGEQQFGVKDGLSI